MSVNLKNIELTDGLGDLKFGMSQNEVKELIGEPDETEMIDYAEEGEDGMKSLAWHYDSHEFSLGFDEEDDWLLVTISISSEAFTLDGEKLIGLSKDMVKKAIDHLNITDLELDDWSNEEGRKQELLSSEEKSVNFWFDNNELTEIQWGAIYLD